MKQQDDKKRKRNNETIPWTTSIQQTRRDRNNSARRDGGRRHPDETANNEVQLNLYKSTTAHLNKLYLPCPSRNQVTGNIPQSMCDIELGQDNNVTRTTWDPGKCVCVKNRSHLHVSVIFLEKFRYRFRWKGDIWSWGCRHRFWVFRFSGVSSTLGRSKIDPICYADVVNMIGAGSEEQIEGDASA